MPTKTSTDAQPTASPELVTEMQAKWMEALTALAQTHQRVAEQLVELTVATAKEGLRTCTELTSNAVEAARAMRPPEAAAAEAGADPFAWYQKGVMAAVEGTQKGFRLLETNAQALTRSAERLHSSAERTGKEIQGALTSCVTRMKDIYTRN